MLLEEFENTSAVIEPTDKAIAKGVYTSLSEVEAL